MVALPRRRPTRRLAGGHLCIVARHVGRCALCTTTMCVRACLPAACVRAPRYSVLRRTSAGTYFSSSGLISCLRLSLPTDAPLGGPSPSPRPGRLLSCREAEAAIDLKKAPPARGTSAPRASRTKTSWVKASGSTHGGHGPAKLSDTAIWVRMLSKRNNSSLALGRYLAGPPGPAGRVPCTQGLPCCPQTASLI